MQCRHIRFAWWLQWLRRPTYELGRNTKSRAGEHSTKERKEYVVLNKNLGTMEISNKSVQPYRSAHFCLERLTDFHKLEIVFALNLACAVTSTTPPVRTIRTGNSFICKGIDECAVTTASPALFVSKTNVTRFTTCRICTT